MSHLPSAYNPIFHGRIKPLVDHLASKLRRAGFLIEDIEYSAKSESTYIHAIRSDGTPFKFRVSSHLMGTEGIEPIEPFGSAPGYRVNVLVGRDLEPIYGKSVDAAVANASIAQASVNQTKLQRVLATMKKSIPEIPKTGLEQLQATTGMTREQIKRAYATGAGRFPPDTFARVPAEADKRLAELFEHMRAQRRMALGAPIDTAEKAGKLRRLIRANSPVDTGALRDSWDDPWTVQLMPDGGLKIDNPLPYARIQDLGGTIHRVSSAGKAYTIRIKAQHYIGKAIAAYNASEAGQELPVSQVNIAEYGLPRMGALVRAAVELLRQRRGTVPA